MRLKDKVVVVTASTRGIGLAIVEACAKEGAIVYMGARNMERAKERAAALNAQGYQVRPVYNDASVLESYQQMIESVIDLSGHIDVLINNFGTSDPKTDLDIEHTDYHHFIDTIQMNLASVFLPVQAVIPYMRQNKGGSIINISSVGGIIPDLSRIGYAISKNAVNYLTKNIAVQAAKDQIRCNAVMPGMTATEAVTNNMSEDFTQFFLKHSPIQRMAKPEEIAHAVVYFASDESAFTTGQVMAVSGGFGLATSLYGDMIHLNKKH
ncbi:7alpha-hydroxysteroid dehydrogenase [Beduini massiliensis]|uniref:7alpha-hydroxysteroid dehydrogenase n=1 Tax=Beduini massiliensis TaxID=1585974 RepID=UPI00059A7C59|nr:SDR family oxidoreductase [Beduini massiliensis]